MKKLRSICKDKKNISRPSCMSVGKTAASHRKPSQIYICSTFEAIPALTSHKMHNLILQHTKQLLENLDE